LNPFPRYLRLDENRGNDPRARENKESIDIEPSNLREGYSIEV